MTSLDEARRTYRDGLADGTHCPCCDRYGQLYRRKFPAAAAHALIAMHVRTHNLPDPGWLFMPDVLAQLPGKTERQGGDWAKARHWGLIEPRPGERDDGSTRTGWWRLTDRGRAFALDQLMVAKYALVYEGETHGYDGDYVGIRTCLGHRFDYQELIGPSLPPIPGQQSLLGVTS